jgi:hypothetical protein
MKVWLHCSAWCLQGAVKKSIQGIEFCFQTIPNVWYECAKIDDEVWINIFILFYSNMVFMVCGHILKYIIIYFSFKRSFMIYSKWPFFPVFRLLMHHILFFNHHVGCFIIIDIVRVQLSWKSSMCVCL